MAGSVNKVILVGRLGRDPEVRNTQSGAKIVQLSIATSESWTDKHTGERRERTEWHKVVIWNEHTAGVAERFLRKGSNVYLEGELQTRKWEDKQGVERYTTEIVISRFRGDLEMLDSKSDREPSQQKQPAQSQSYGSQRSMSDVDASQDPLDDEIPF
ncbi:single-stranded DNA-binding protein [Saccharibacter floricola]|uniref:single-stranded DNA-binding protein n=2 Tax=Saccharibacter floricola TaxID=231053 RepID=UPI0003805035|nr:single-stranded DNA-binding protein [Saccharibacter floricola]